MEEPKGSIKTDGSSRLIAITCERAQELNKRKGVFTSLKWYFGWQRNGKWYWGSSIRSHSMEDTWHKGGKEKPPIRRLNPMWVVNQNQYKLLDWVRNWMAVIEWIGDWWKEVGALRQWLNGADSIAYRGGPNSIWVLALSFGCNVLCISFIKWNSEEMW